MLPEVLSLWSSERFIYRLALPPGDTVRVGESRSTQWRVTYRFIQCRTADCAANRPRRHSLSHVTVLVDAGARRDARGV